MKIKDLFKDIKISENFDNAFLDKPFLGVSIDSRSIKPGEIFIAFEGENIDGNVFIESALEKGALFAVSSKKSCDSPNCLIIDNTLSFLHKVAENYRNLLDRTSFFVITGSNGKTSTKDILKHLLECNYNVFATEKNLNNELGVPLNILKIKYDCDIAIIEAGMNHFGELENISRLIKPDYIYITNIGNAHIEFFGSMEEIAKAKFEILKYASKNAKFFLNVNDKILQNEHSKYINDNIKIIPININYSIESTDFSETKFKINNTDYITNLIGEHMINNITACIKMADFFDINEICVRKQLTNIKLTEMRMEKMIKFGEKIINDAYNANSISMLSGLEIIDKLSLKKGSRKILILGDMFELGDQSDKFHEEICFFLNNLSPHDYIILLLGENFLKASRIITNHKVRKFSSHSEAAIYIQRYLLHRGNLFYFKASRGMRLEKILEEMFI